MVQHLTLTTRFWFVDVMTGQTGQPTEERVDDDFHVDECRPAWAVLDAYRQETEADTAMIRDLPLSTPPVWWPEGMFGDWRLESLHEVLLHVIVETSCHAGHLDAARELIDGRTWDYAHGRLSGPE